MSDCPDLGRHSDDFDRLSVAYSLSLAVNAETILGQMGRDIEVPDVRPSGPELREDDGPFERLDGTACAPKPHVLE